MTTLMKLVATIFAATLLFAGPASATTLYVGNLSWIATEEDLTTKFSEYGIVAWVKISRDQGTGRSKGFAFVSMPVPEQAQDAIAGLNGTVLLEKVITVNISRAEETQGDRGSRDPRRR